MSVGEITGIGAALARIGEIQSLVGAGPPAASPPAPVAAGFAQALSAAGAGVVSDSVSGAGPLSAPGLNGPGPFANVAPTTAPGGAAAIANLPGASELASQIDRWIARKNPGSPLAGYGAIFVREGLANGIDPRALAAIARAESGLGTDPGARSINNAFGWGPHRPFASWEENIATVAAGLKKGYLDEGLVTLAQIQQKYCPVGATNDPTGLNSNWLPNTTALYAELGGDPNGSVATAEAPGAI